MYSRVNYASGSVWEDLIGYSRAVRVGGIIEVSGTVASDETGAVVGEDDAYLQTKYIYQKIEAVLLRAGATLHHVVRVRMYVTDISRWEEYGKAHCEVFHLIKPCNTMVQVAALIGNGFLIEIEATAILE